MDGLGFHYTEQFLAESAARNIEILFLIGYAFDQLQPLDLLIFAIMKQTCSASRCNRLLNPPSNKVVRMLNPIDHRMLNPQFKSALVMTHFDLAYP
jgi:hypothetical protein